MAASTRHTDTRCPAAVRPQRTLRYERLLVQVSIVALCCFSLISFTLIAVRLRGDGRLQASRFTRARQVPGCSGACCVKRSDFVCSIDPIPGPPSSTNTGTTHALLPRNKEGTADPLRVTRVMCCAWFGCGACFSALEPALERKKFIPVPSATNHML